MTARKPTPRDVARLRAMAQRLRDEEARQERHWGPRQAGSMRSASMLDMQSIERAIAWIEAARGDSSKEN